MRSLSSRLRPGAILLALLLALQVLLVALPPSPTASALKWASLAGVALLAIQSGLASHRSAAEARALARLRQLLGAPTQEPPLQPLVTLGTELLPDAAGCALYLADPAGRSLYTAAAAPQGPHGAPIPAVAQRAFQERRELLSADLAPGAALSAQEPGADSYALPVLATGEPLGVLVIQLKGQQRPNRAMESRSALLAAAAGVMLLEHRLRQSLASALPQGHLVLDALTDAVVVLDDHDQILLHNGALATILGPDLAGLKGSRLQVRSPDVRVQRLAYLVGDTSAPRATRRRVEIDEPIHATLDVEQVPVRDEAGRTVRVVSMRDVTSTSNAVDSQTTLLRATAHGLQAPLAALSARPESPELAEPARQLERLRQDLLAVAEPLENLTQSAAASVTWGVLLTRLKEEFSSAIQDRVRVHSHPALDSQPVPDLWLDHLLITLVEEAARSSPEGVLTLDVEGRPGEMVFSVRASAASAAGDPEANSLGFGATQATLSLQVARRLAEALGGYLWQAQEPGALRFQLILPTARRRGAV